MTSHPIPPLATAVAIAVSLGAGFWAGSSSGREANAATTHPGLMSPSLMPGSTTTATGITATGITVTGTGIVAGRPDTLRLDLSVTARAGTVGKALADADATMARVHQSLKASGVAAADLQTSNLSISPVYAHPAGGAPRISGYTVSEGVTATLRELARAGTAITEATRAGGDNVRIGGIELDLADTSALVTAARDRAVAIAKAKAEQYAKATGRGLGHVVSLTESVSEPTPVAYPRAAAAAQGVPIEPGSQDVGVTVTVVYAFS